MWPPAKVLFDLTDNSKLEIEAPEKFSFDFVSHPIKVRMDTFPSGLC